MPGSGATVPVLRNSSTVSRSTSWPAVSRSLSKSPVKVSRRENRERYSSMVFSTGRKSWAAREAVGHFWVMSSWR